MHMHICHSSFIFLSYSEYTYVIQVQVLSYVYSEYNMHTNESGVRMICMSYVILEYSVYNTGREIPT